jgi:hypothetical protein
MTSAVKSVSQFISTDIDEFIIGHFKKDGSKKQHTSTCFQQIGILCDMKQVKNTDMNNDEKSWEELIAYFPLI